MKNGLKHLLVFVLCASGVYNVSGAAAQIPQERVPTTQIAPGHAPAAQPLPEQVPTTPVTPEQFNERFRLLPRPQQVDLLPGEGLRAGDLHTIRLSEGAVRPPLDDLLANLRLSDPAEKGAGNVAKNTGKNAAPDAPGTLSLRIGGDKELPSSPEGYVLEIAGGRASIAARGQAGLFYGCQTLRQLLEDARDQDIAIPALKISDFPEIPYRGVHWDLKHHIDSLSYYYRTIDRLAHLKINALIIEFEDKLKYEKAPLIGASNAISIADFAALSDYAKERNIRISPLVQGLGHVPFILKHEAYRHLRDDTASDWAFCALNPGTYELQFKLYEDAIRATPHGKYLHVGGDEVGELGKSELARKSGMKPFELQMYWLKKVTDFAHEHGRIPIFWDDMIFKLSGLYRTTYDGSVPEAEAKAAWEENRALLDKNLELFPKNCVYMRWNYGSQYVWGNKAALDWYRSKGLHAMAATAAQTNWMLMPRNNSNREAIKGFCRITREKALDGILCTSWDDASPHMETFMRGMYFFGLYSWNAPDIGYEEANAIFRQRFYGPRTAGAAFEYQDLLEKALSFWEIALVDEGRRDKPRRPFELMRLPDRNMPGEWRKEYRDRLTLARQAIEEYAEIKERIDRVRDLAERNLYHLRLMEQINELQVYPARLILLLEKFDEAPTLEKAEPVREIHDYVRHFEEIRGNFEKVFSETRVLNMPDDYLLDSNSKHSHMANSKTSGWMYRFELAMNERMERWFENFDF